MLKKLLARKKLVIAIIVIAVVGFLLISRRGSGKPVVVGKVERGAVEKTLVLSGTVSAHAYAKLAFQTSGVLTRVVVTAGDNVKKGQFLASLDTVQLNSSYESAKSALRLTAATRDKVYDALKDKGNSETFTEKETRITAEVAHDQAYEAFKKAEKALRDANLYAPFAGMITSIATKTPGTYVSAAVTQVEIIDPATVFFSVSSDQTEVIDIKEGQEVTIVLDVKDEEIKGNVTKVGKAPILGQTEILYEVEVKADLFQYDWVRVGMSGDATIHLERAEDVLFVDSTFIKEDDDGVYLLVGKDKKRVNVKKGLEGEDRVEILSDDIHENDEVYD